MKICLCLIIPANIDLFIEISRLRDGIAKIKGFVGLFVKNER
jgi:hypothetical protein